MSLWLVGVLFFILIMFISTMAWATNAHLDRIERKLGIYEDDEGKWR